LFETIETEKTCIETDTCSALRVGRVGRDFGDLRLIRRGIQAALQRLQGVGLPLMGHHE